MMSDSCRLSTLGLNEVLVVNVLSTVYYSSEKRAFVAIESTRNVFNRRFSLQEFNSLKAIPPVLCVVDCIYNVYNYCVQFQSSQLAPFPRVIGSSKTVIHSITCKTTISVYTRHEHPQRFFSSNS